MSFFVALPSHANRREFPQNQANSFKTRLPYPLHLPGGQWQVGLSAISLPDTQVNMYDLVKKGDHVMGIKWIQTIPTPVNHDSHESALAQIDDLKDLDWIMNGVGFMKAAINHAEQPRRAKAVLEAKFVNAKSQHMYAKFRWEGEDLLIDNTNVCHCGFVTTPNVAFHTKLALKIGWIVLSSDHSSGFVLGPNLQQEFLGEQVPAMTSGSDWNDMNDGDGNPVFRAVNARTYLDLSMSCSWCFTNLNKAFRSIVREPTHSLHVYPMWRAVSSWGIE